MLVELLYLLHHHPEASSCLFPLAYRPGEPFNVLLKGTTLHFLLLQGLPALPLLINTFLQPGLPFPHCLCQLAYLAAHLHHSASRLLKSSLQLHSHPLVLVNHSSAASQLCLSAAGQLAHLVKLMAQLTHLLLHFAHLLLHLAHLLLSSLDLSTLETYYLLAVVGLRQHLTPLPAQCLFFPLGFLCRSLCALKPMLELIDGAVHPPDHVLVALPRTIDDGALLSCFPASHGQVLGGCFQ